MLDYLQKFNNLPKEFRDKISTPAVIKTIEELEKIYGISLSIIVMKVAVKDININDLSARWLKELNLDEIRSKQLVNDLKNKVFFGLDTYLSQPTYNKVEREKPKQLERQNVTSNRIMTQRINIVNQKQTPNKAGFFFSPEDEEEIRELSQRIDGYSVDSNKDKQLDEKLDNIIRQTKINFGSEALAQRFNQILRTYLYGIRDRIEIKQSLIKPFNFGGLSFDEESADKVLAIIDDNFKNLSQGARSPLLPKITKEKISQKDLANLSNIGVRDIEYDLASALPKAKEMPSATPINKPRNEDVKLMETEKAEKPQEEIGSQQKPALAKISTESKIKPKIIKEDLKKEPEVAPEVKTKPIKKEESEKLKTQIPSEVKLTEEVIDKNGFKPVVRRQFEPESKIKVVDVKYVPRVMTPTDELKYMDLISFRRIDNDPVRTINKIRGKIQLLEDEGYAKRLLGIKSWRLSPVNRLYLEMGQASISENKSVDDIIEERKAKGSNYLTNKEFEAIMDLNKSLRF